MFGALALLLGEPGHWFNLTASCRSELIRLPGPLLGQIVGRFPHARNALLGEATQAEQVARSQAQNSGQMSGAPPAAQGGQRHATMVGALNVDALVDAGLAQGSEVLVVDQNRCTNCLACVDACGRRHGLSRLELRGLQLENLLFPAACRHCDDPVCLLCSVNGIQRLPSGEITIVEDNCIGCGACAERCPYGNIRMHPAQQPRRGLLSGIWAMLWGPDRSSPDESHDPKVPRVAVKCDLCAGYNNYACVTACPVGAAARVDPTNLVKQAGGMLGMQYKSQQR
jgi:Fe-S-cluster-containing hydrogenase component 2